MSDRTATWKWWTERAIGVAAAGSGIAAWIATCHSAPIAPASTTTFSAVVSLVQSEAGSGADRLRAAHILVSWAGAAESTQRRTKAEAFARIEEARARLERGEDFASVAAAYNDDATRARGGSLGSFARGTFPRPFEAAVETLGVGQVSGIIETRFGFHIAKRL